MPGHPSPKAPKAIAIVRTGVVAKTINDCGPPRADMSSGMVMNGPAPSMLAMFSAVAGNRESRRSRCGGSAGGSAWTVTPGF
jgi:hypothetical protein